MRTRRHKLQVSTFPFLAVLLCAMGALLLVLLVMDRRAHDAARYRATQAARRAAEDAGREAEARHSAFERQRQEAEDARRRDRDAAHARLAGQEADVQKEIRLVRDELARAAQRLRAEQDDETALKQKIETEHAKAGEEERALAGVRAEEAAKAARSETSRKELGQMTAALARLEKNLADLKEARKREENTYSVVPYNGKRGENRRPVYVECAAGRVIFHPDPTPLDEPFSPSAVRAEVDRRLARPEGAAAARPGLRVRALPDAADPAGRRLHVLSLPAGVAGFPDRLRLRIRGQGLGPGLPRRGPGFAASDVADGRQAVRRGAVLAGCDGPTDAWRPLRA